MRGITAAAPSIGFNGSLAATAFFYSDSRASCRGLVLPSAGSVQARAHPAALHLDRPLRLEHVGDGGYCRTEPLCAVGKGAFCRTHRRVATVAMVGRRAWRVVAEERVGRRPFGGCRGSVTAKAAAQASRASHPGFLLRFRRGKANTRPRRRPQVRASEVVQPVICIGGVGLGKDALSGVGNTSSTPARMRRFAHHPRPKCPTRPRYQTRPSRLQAHTIADLLLIDVSRLQRRDAQEEFSLSTRWSSRAQAGRDTAPRTPRRHGTRCPHFAFGGASRLRWNHPSSRCA